MTRYNDTVDNLTDLSQKQLDVLKAGVQIPAKWFFAITDTAGEIETRMKEMFEDTKTVSTEQFFTRWMENVENLTRNTIEKSLHKPHGNHEHGKNGSRKTQIGCNQDTQDNE